MQSPDAAVTGDLGADGRPTMRLPTGQLIRISLYWLGLSSIFAGLNAIMLSRLVFTGLEPDKDHVGRTLVPVGHHRGGSSRSSSSRRSARSPTTPPRAGGGASHTSSSARSLTRSSWWGSRQATALVAIAAFIALLQFSSNFAQGPFQGYVPDLVPAPQVGLASALVGMMQIFGNVAGFIIAGLATANHDYALGIIALAVLELATMLSVVIRVREGSAAKPRNGRSWWSIAGEAWGTDILREHSFLWLVGSRLAILMAGAFLTQLAIAYLGRSMALGETDSGTVFIVLVGLVALGTIIAVVPAARISDRVGRKPVIWASCVIGAIGLGITALAPSLPFVFVGAIAYGLSAGIFLAVDWALMTDIIPKASTGRYMGISNVATASSEPSLLPSAWCSWMSAIRSRSAADPGWPSARRAASM